MADLVGLDDAPVAKYRGGIPYVNDQGQGGIGDGRAEVKLPTTGGSYSWIDREHPDRTMWVADEQKQRASFLGTKRHLIPFLVPHRFEGDRARPGALNRANLGYSIGLNASYLQEMFGHIRTAVAHYTWGVLGDGKLDDDTAKPPADKDALKFWDDATGAGVTWKEFFEGSVLEWMLTSLGAFIVVDTNKPAGPMTKHTADAGGYRSSFKLVPYSAMEDCGRNGQGYWFVKLAECVDTRKPRMEANDPGEQRNHVIYQLQPDGTTTITRYDTKGGQIGPVVTQKIKDMNGRGMLPLIPVQFGTHPDIDFMGSGLLMGLDDIVIDLYNLVSEVREAYRDSVFGFLVYSGAESQTVKDQLATGSRFLTVGDDPHSKLERIAGESSEVDAGIKLIEMGLKNWILSAKRKAMEIQQTMQTHSAVALKAEFQLDLIPLMISITERLDAIETEAMFVLAQLEGKTVEEANLLRVHRETDFQMEEEASRIARIVQEFLDAVPGMPAVLLQKLIMRWAGSLSFINLDEPVDTADGGDGRPLREMVEEQALEIAEADMNARIQQNTFGIMGAAGVGTALGGNKGGGGNPNPPRKPTPPRPRSGPTNAPR